jgi:hypothetical protein
MVASLLLSLLSAAQDGGVQRSLSATDVYLRALPLSFRIDTEKGHGSGVLVARGIIATNHHVVGDAKSIEAYSGAGAVSAELIYANPKRDLALLRLSTTPRASPPQLREMKSLQVGETVYALGNPRELDFTFSDGIVSAVRPSDPSHPITTTAPISPGSSGGGLFDSRGRLVGLTTAIRIESQNLNFVVPADWIVAALQTSRGKGDAGTVVESASDASEAIPFSARRRPEALRCTASEKLRVATFSAGNLEILERRPARAELFVWKFRTEIPRLHEGAPDATEYVELVLDDIDPAGNSARFSSGSGQLLFFFSGTSVTFMFVQSAETRGRPRALVTLGECDSTTELEFKTAIAKRNDEVSQRYTAAAKQTEAGEDDQKACIMRRSCVACIRVADAFANTDRADAAAYLERGCEIDAECCVRAVSAFEGLGDHKTAQKLKKRACGMGRCE